MQGEAGAAPYSEAALEPQQGQLCEEHGLEGRVRPDLRNCLAREAKQKSEEEL